MTYQQLPPPIDADQLDREAFITELGRRTTPERLYSEAPEIYEYMTRIFRVRTNDSVCREWAFQWASEKLGLPYDEIYDRWMGVL